MTKKDVPAVKPNIKGIDIRKFILIPPEIDKEELIELIEKEGFKLSPISKSPVLFTLDAFQIPFKEFDSKLDKINQIKDKIKKLQINYLNGQKDKIKFDHKITSLIASFLVEVNKDSKLNSKQALLVLQSILGKLYKQDIDGTEFLDEETLNHLANAAVSKILGEAKLNLNKAMLNMLIQIRKLTILWFYESVSLDYYNLRTDREEVSKLQEFKKVELDGLKYEVLPINVDDKKHRLLFNEVEHSLITLDIGKKTQNNILPVMFSIFVDNAGLKWKINYTDIIIESIRRAKIEILHQIRHLKYAYNEKSVEDLLKEQPLIEKTFEFLYRLLLNFRNTTYAENKLLKRHYKGDYQRNLRRFLGGSISKSIMRVSPLDTLPQLDLQEKKLELMINIVSELKYGTLEVLQELIKAKKEENPSLFKKATKKLQEIGENILSKTLAELMDKLLK